MSAPNPTDVTGFLDFLNNYERWCRAEAECKDKEARMATMSAEAQRQVKELRLLMDEHKTEVKGQAIAYSKCRSLEPGQAFRALVIFGELSGTAVRDAAASGAAGSSGS